MTTHHNLQVPPELEGARLDRCLAELNPEWTRSRVRRLIDAGHVRLNQEPAKPSATVHHGDRIVVDEPPLETLDAEAEDIPLDIVFEDDDLLLAPLDDDLEVLPEEGEGLGCGEEKAPSFRFYELPELPQVHPPHLPPGVERNRPHAIRPEGREEMSLRFQRLDELSKFLPRLVGEELRVEVEAEEEREALARQHRQRHPPPERSPEGSKEGRAERGTEGKI